MAIADPFQKARSLPSGAHFYRCALQVKPHHYSGTFRGKKVEGDARSYAEAIVAKAAKIGISVLAITDHNDVSGGSVFQNAAKNHPVTIFPGFELSSNEGIHVLCLYAPDTTEAQLGRYLGEFGIRNPSPSSGLCKQSFVNILACVRQQGGITIAAHATSENGVLTRLDGQARIRNWQSEDLLAIQIPGPVADLPQNYKPIVENRNPAYRRDHPPEDKLALAVVNAKDVAKPDDLSDPAATCWIKMSEVSIEGLYQALLDPGSRIRLNSDPMPDECAKFVTATWEGGFLDGTHIHFNTNMNVLIGGRGTGKSTIIESLRYIFGSEPLGEEARKAHEGIVHEVLRPGTKVSLLVSSHRPTPREYRIERTVPNPAIVRNADTGEIVHFLAEQVLPRVEVYGQHEISELTKSPEKLTRLLERFTRNDDSLAQRRRSLRNALEQSRGEILKARSGLAQVRERLAMFSGLEEALKRYQEAGFEDRLKEQSLLVREEHVLATVDERLAPFRDCLAQLGEELPIDRFFLSSKALADLPGREILSQANEAFKSLNRDLKKIAGEIRAALEQAEERLQDVRKRWGQRKQEVQKAYEQQLRELGKFSVDGDDFIRLRHRIEELRPLKQRESLFLRLEEDLQKKRRSLCAEWEEVKQTEFNILHAASARVTKKLPGRVRVEVMFEHNREPLFELLRNEIDGRLSEAIDRLHQCKDFSLPEFAGVVREGADALQKKYGLLPSQAESIAKAGDAVSMRIEGLDMPSTTRIELNTAAPGERENWQTLDRLSTGQKATAVLLLLLLESDAPLLVDQPEDDLDNRFIFEEIVPRMREEKRRRQFIFSTHNANIPVLGDAELILGLDTSGETDAVQVRIAPEHMASIDAPPVRKLVEELLEGGREAFERRRRKYGF